MGQWYVIANIPTALEKNAYNAIETYSLNDDGTIATTFVFREDSFDGEEKRYTPKGFVKDTESNALWGMRFIWPIKAEYRVIYLDDDYQTTIIGRSQRDYVWLMSRQSELDEGYYQELVSYISEQGYDISELMKVPQRWDQEPEKQ